MDTRLQINNGHCIPASAYGMADAKIELDLQYGVSPYTVTVKVDGEIIRVVDGIVSDDTDQLTRVVISNLPVAEYSVEAKDSSIPPMLAIGGNGFDAVSPPYATLNGNVNPSGQLTDVYFDYGLTTEYGFSFPYGQVNGTGATKISSRISCGGFSPETQLLPNTEYHYRIRATNPNGTALGEDMVFSTPSYAPVVVTLPATDIL